MIVPPLVFKQTFNINPRLRGDSLILIHRMDEEEPFRKEGPNTRTSDLDKLIFDHET